MDEHEQVDDSTPTPEPVKETRLRRSTKRRMVGGVAGGIAERFDIDANIVRVVFVVLTVLYGLGAAIYLAMWVLIPQSGTGADEFEATGEEPPASNLKLLRYVVLAAIVVIVVIAISTLGGAPRVGNGFAALWLAFLFVLAVLSLRSSARQHMLRRFIALVFVSFITVIILLSGAVLGFLASTGVPLTGGSGARSIQPSSLGQVQRTYRTEFGALTVDLRQVRFTSSPTSVTASVAVGLLTVEVPADAIVYLKTHIGIGPVDENGPVEYNGQFYQEQAWTAIPSSLKTVASQQSAPHLIVNAQVGVGRIEIERGTPGESR
jgi:phage shock protein PspC (stress-responsive transcriptional regulator)